MNYSSLFTDALQYFNEGFKPFILERFQKKFGEDADRKLFEILETKEFLFDTTTIIKIILAKFDDVFANTFMTVREKNYLLELRGWRNQWAHQYDFTVEDAV